MQSVFTKESEILTKNIGSEPLRRNNVVLSHENLRMIAILHESVVSVLTGKAGEMVWAELLVQTPLYWSSTIISTRVQGFIYRMVFEMAR